MWIIVSSVLVGLIGVVASRIGLTYLTADGASRDPHAYWALGLVTLLPAWLVAFVGLLGATPSVRHVCAGPATWPRLTTPRGCGGWACSPSFRPG